ncbi:DNA-3-methyladenine glycosylase I [Rhodococcus sp. IEGM 1379]|uniref:DNA-3-methyladenine glycosylase I n=1 Tax=Rhodococcus sp. IEGM 1379 TaxID=3047086 RepID=UPI0024B83CBA|nr:DNA-3-methyladenine glycosylase I [Rhodococcus sp. IEGM 1379]MDI9915683.1 DNA-3-methyladenine glycosylase I [Rhodococcus sp. IEGM 1379]
MTDGLIRCGWVTSSADDTLYRDYHDHEWGQPLHGRDALFERLALEAFQSGLSWITILRKREAFRAAFDGFDPEKIAEYGAADVDRLLGDASIVRNRSKIEATISNARLLVNSPELDLDSSLWSFAPPRRTARLTSIADVPAVTPESTAMAKELKRLGFKFIGPTTAYALMQATGMVDDHVADCWVPILPGR